jgi:hypothetical protein
MRLAPGNTLLQQERVADMVILSAYRLEAEALTAEERDRRMSEISGLTCEWLRTKGVADPAASGGSFTSQTAAGDGRFVRAHVRAGAGYFDELSLTEYSRAGLIFTTRLTSVAFASRLIVHATLSVASATTVVSPIATDPRCPAVVRTLLARYADWTLNGTAIPDGKASSVFGHEGAEAIAKEITAASRAFPLVVVSQNEGDSVWPNIAERLASDLAGLARVVQLDEQASWSLTDMIGKRNSCYLGAIRLYWPMRGVETSELRYLGTVWTASTLLSSDVDRKGESRFRNTVGRMVMGTAALTIAVPVEIRDIQSAEARRRFEEIQARANASNEELEIARLYAAEIEELKLELENTKSQVSGLLGRAQAAEYALGQLKSAAPDESPYAPDETESAEPESGDVRFYKKTHSKAAYDVLVSVSDCGHTSWQGATKADKAKKGIEKLEGRNDWKNVQHCGSCTGGGMWKVRW